MAVLKILRYGDPGLRRKAEPVGAITPELKRRIGDMVDTMYDEVGIGLAAPQVGIALRLIVVGDEDGRDTQAIINPVITDRRGEALAEEGCLSLPGIFAPVARAEWVRVEAQDIHGKPLTIEARGLRARVLQHEMDHLDGVLFIDHLDAMARDRIKRKIKKEGFPEGSTHHAFAL
jgi:peptide deformylase